MNDSPHILVVDDHREIRDLVGRLLERDGYRVSTAADGAEMRRIMRDARIDLIVLDVMLPAVDGLALCRDIRAGAANGASGGASTGTQNVPIIMLTAKGEEIDRVLGLEMGADDYVTKPFSGRELTARIKAVLRRTHTLPPTPDDALPTVYRFAGWTLHIARRELEAADGAIVPLSSGDYSLLLAFVGRPNRVLSREQLLDLAKGRSAAPLDRSIDLQVSRLRRKIEADPANPQIVRTVWGDGYMFVAEVTKE